MGRKQRISYLPAEAMDDEMRAEMEHHEVLPGTDASMAPGFGTAEELAAAKAARDY
jgi:hypothetical protein